MIRKAHFEEVIRITKNLLEHMHFGGKNHGICVEITLRTLERDERDNYMEGRGARISSRER